MNSEDSIRNYVEVVRQGIDKKFKVGKPASRHCCMTKSSSRKGASTLPVNTPPCITPGSRTRSNPGYVQRSPFIAQIIIPTVTNCAFHLLKKRNL
jgi:hypothetical protein